GIPCGPIYRLDEALSQPQVLHREMVVERPHPTMGTVRLLGVPYKLSETPAAITRTPPLFAEHTAEILDELGLSHDEIARLSDAGVIRVAQQPARQTE
ncbi:MAG: CoA transferase, partial [Thermomicrobiales bacterium]